MENAVKFKMIPFPSLVKNGGHGCKVTNKGAIFEETCKQRYSNGLTIQDFSARTQRLDRIENVAKRVIHGPGATGSRRKCCNDVKSDNGRVKGKIL